MAFKRKRQHSPQATKRVKRNTTLEQGTQPSQANAGEEEQKTPLLNPHKLPNGLTTTPVMAPNQNYSNLSLLEAHPFYPSERAMLNPKLMTQISEICRESSPHCAQELMASQLDTLPAFIYSYKHNTSQLHRTSLVTGEQSSHRLPFYQFKIGCCWSEVPGGSLLITGGGFPVVREVVRIDTRREFAVCHCPPMLAPRSCHAAVHHTQHLYVLGGYDDARYLSSCERYVCAEYRWEALPPLPRTCSSTSGVVVERNLYALGGHYTEPLDFVQKLSLESLTWELMQLRLPHAGAVFPCFKVRDTEVYLVVRNTLCSFTALQVLPQKTLTSDIRSWVGVSYYHRGTLYCSSDEGAVCSHEVGSLSN
jgi:hypothetical protein